MTTGRGKAIGVMAVFAGAVLLGFMAAVLVAGGCMAQRVSAPAMQPPGGHAGGRAADDPVDWDYWQSVNPDVVAWVEIEGTQVSQPVVQASKDDPQRYLTHDVYGEWNPFGCPYVDSACERGIDSPNVVIVGHNISFPPAMFHDLEQFHDAAFAQGHRQVVLRTPDGTRRYLLAGVDTVDGSDAVKRTAFSSEADFEGYLAERLEYCDIRLAAPGGSGHMLTLCTCSYFENPADERTLLYAVLHCTTSATSTRRLFRV